jgi:hypothetical protein
VARKPLLDKPQKLNDIIRVIAGFGGFLGRKERWRARCENALDRPSSVSWISP